MRHKKRKIIVMVIAAFAVLAVSALAAALGCSQSTLELSIPEKTVITLEYGEHYEEPEVTAWYEGGFLNLKKAEVEVQKQGHVDDGTLGSYEVTYRASCKNLTAVSVVTVIIEDHESPVIKLVSDPDHFTSPVGQYEEEGYTAVDNYDGDLTNQVKREEKNGVVTYKVTDSSGNTATAVRRIVYKDVVAPEIHLEGGTEMGFEAGRDYIDPGYRASDDCDGDLTEKVTVEGTVNGHKLGNYTLVYRVEDSSNNVCEATRHVSVADTIAPDISLKGDAAVYIRKGEEYKEPGYQAADSFEGDKTAEVRVENGVNGSRPGVYSIVYTVSDSSGNQAKAFRTVYVYEKQTEVNPVDPGDKIVYLTFDDGPGQYTERLLNILDKYGVKATFFVTNQFPGYQNMIGEEYRRGHTVALHTYSHDYSVLYRSQKNYFDDLQKISDICYAQTGEKPSILRFPGGSSNRISANYCEGIMSALVKAVPVMGYQYCDWNVSSGDAGETTSAAQVAANVIDGIKNHDVSVVLQHDIKGYSVDAVEEILAWGLANGYRFLPMDSSSPMVHHSVNN